MLKKSAVIGMGVVEILDALLLVDIDDPHIGGRKIRSKRSDLEIDNLIEGKYSIKREELWLSNLIRKVISQRKYWVKIDTSFCKDVELVLIEVQSPTDENKIPSFKSLRSASNPEDHYINIENLVNRGQKNTPNTIINFKKPILLVNSNLDRGEVFYLAHSYEQGRKRIFFKAIEKKKELERFC